MSSRIVLLLHHRHGLLKLIRLLLLQHIHLILIIFGHVRHLAVPIVKRIYKKPPRQR